VKRRATTTTTSSRLYQLTTAVAAYSRGAHIHTVVCMWVVGSAVWGVVPKAVAFSRGGWRMSNLLRCATALLIASATTAWQPARLAPGRFRSAITMGEWRPKTVDPLGNAVRGRRTYQQSRARTSDACVPRVAVGHAGGQGSHLRALARPTHCRGHLCAAGPGPALLRCAEDRRRGRPLVASRLGGAGAAVRGEPVRPCRHNRQRWCVRAAAPPRARARTSRCGAASVRDCREISRTRVRKRSAAVGAHGEMVCAMLS
jgi:hypothetical protein